MKQRSVIVAAALIASLARARPVDADTAATIPMCNAAQLSLAADDEGGAFTGMNHAGTAIELTNQSTEACRLGAFAKVALEDARGDALKLDVVTPSPFQGPLVDGHRVPTGHGPVVLPIVLAGGAEAIADARWVSAPVFDPGVCVDAASLAVTVGDDTLRTPLAAHLCGADLDHVTIDVHQLALKR